MNKTLALIISFIFIGLTASSNIRIENDTVLRRLTLQESRAIKNLVGKDTLTMPAYTNLQYELFKHDANLLYKYRLDSIKTEIPLDYNPYVQSFIDAFVNKGKRQIGKMVSLGNYYFPIFENALNAYELPLGLKYLPIIESAMDPHAVSKSGALGLWQFMYTTGKGYGLNIDGYVDERKDPIQSSHAAAKYLKEAYGKFGDWLLALASYNCGQGAVSRALERAGGAKTFWEVYNYLPIETRNYVPKFIAVTYMMNYYHVYDGIVIPDAGFKIDIDSIYVNKFVSFESISDALNLEIEHLKILNPSYKKNIVNGSLKEPKRLIVPKIHHNDYLALFDVLNKGSEPTEIDNYHAVYKPTNSFYIVAKGDNLSSIANKHDVEVQDLKVWNKLSNFNIFPGQKLVVSKGNGSKETSPISPKFISYTVKIGDTLSSISKKFSGVSVGAIQELNNLSSYSLKAGMVLMINKLN